MLSCEQFRCCLGASLRHWGQPRDSACIYVTGMEKGLGKEMTRFGLSVILGIFGVDAGRYADEPWWFHGTCAMVFPLKD